MACTQDVLAVNIARGHRFGVARSNPEGVGPRTVAELDIQTPELGVTTPMITDLARTGLPLP